MTKELDEYLAHIAESRKNCIVMGRDWELVDTTLAAEFTDEQLLMFTSEIPFMSGWGLVSELMKRYKKLSGCVGG